MNRNAVTYSIVVLALLAVAGISVVYAPKEYRGTSADSTTVSIPNSVANQSDKSKSMMEQKRAAEIVKLMNIVKESAPESDGGSYVDEFGNIVIQVASKSNPDLENKLMKASEQSNKVKIKYVKYSESELNESYRILSSKKDLGIFMSIVDITKNKITVYLSENELKKHRAEITSAIPEDMIDWYVGEFKLVNQTAAV